MENYKRYKENNPHKTDAQIIESLVWELKDKVETIHRLLAHDVIIRLKSIRRFNVNTMITEIILIATKLTMLFVS